MNLLPIEVEESLNERFRGIPECTEVLDIFVEFYKKSGFSKPWIAYFVADSNNEIVGGGGFKGKPKDNSVELSYGTFINHEGKGIGTEICRQLVQLSLQTDPSVKIRARTLLDNVSSIGVLKRNGFVCLGTVQDEDDGEVLEWEYQGDKV
ncbi:GNAT family N-acetyltransferase [Aquiflexum sp.]|uniref:GNAT family N-acetyltransferase n=1 Tax=Aquiflexum sp. TaxID=1872584 RepID=UPI0035934FC9